MVSLKQPDLSAGVVGPQFFGKTNQEKYAAGLRTCRNVMVTKYGTLENRAGLIYDNEVKDSANRVRLIKFIFNADVSYLLEVGDDYIRPYKQGGRISVDGAAAYDAGTTYGIGDLVTYSGVVYWSITASNTANTPNSSPADWYPQPLALLELQTNLSQDYLANFQYVQQNDILTVASQSITPQQALRYSDTKWAWQAFTQSAGILPPSSIFLSVGVGAPAVPAAPTGVMAAGGGSGVPGRYFVSSFNSNGEGPVDYGVWVAFDVGTVGFPTTLSWTPVVGADGYVVYLTDDTASIPIAIIGVTTTAGFIDTGQAEATLTPPIRVANTSAAGGLSFTYAVTAVDDTTGAESLLLGQTPATSLGGTPTDANPNVISWTAVAEASRYNVYRLVAGVYGFIGSTAAPVLSFSDTNILPDTAIQPPTALILFSTPDDYPGVVGYYQQRLGFADTINAPQTVSFSRVGDYYNFSVSTPVRDDDAMQFTIAGKQVQQVRALVDVGKLVIHTSGGEYVALGNQAGAITPDAPGVVLQGSCGASDIAPVTIGNTDLFVQARGTTIRDLSYSIQSTGYVGKDVTIYVPHLLAGQTIVDMDWQQIPYSVLWVVTSDGALLGMTYIKEQELWAWHHHDTADGIVENVCVVAESTQDVVYVVVRRMIDGSTKRYIEHLAPRDFTDIATDAIFVDSALTFDGRNTGATTMELTTGAGWTTHDNLTLTADADSFTSADVGNAIVLWAIVTDDDGVESQESVVCNIIAYTNLRIVTVQPTKDVPVWAQNVALDTWGRAVHEFSGIDHLEGETIVGLGDGNVMPEAVVSGGAFSTALNYMVLHAGLPITADVQTLPIENTQGETVQNKKIRIVESTLMLYSTRGIFIGQDENHLRQWTQRQREPLGDPVSLFTGPVRLPIQGDWQTTGQVFVRQTGPLPLGISAITATAEAGN